MSAIILPEQVRPLSVKERKRLGELEGVIETNMEGFVEVCKAFAEIQVAMLYRESAQTIAEYAKERFDLSRTRFFQFADAGRLLQFIQESTVVDSPEWTPKNEAQLRPLIPVFNKNPAKIPALIEMMVETAPDGKITAAHVSQVVKKEAGEQVKKNINKTRKAAKKSAKVSPEFLAAFEGMLEAISIESESGWATTDRSEATRYLVGLLAAIEG